MLLALVRSRVALRMLVWHGLECAMPRRMAADRSEIAGDPGVMRWVRGRKPAGSC